MSFVRRLLAEKTASNSAYVVYSSITTWRKARVCAMYGTVAVFSRFGTEIVSECIVAMNDEPAAAVLNNGLFRR